MNLKNIEKKVWDRYWKNSKGAQSMSSRLGGVIDFFGSDVDIQDIEQTDLDALIDHCYSIGNTPATINRKLSVFSKIQQYAYDRKLTNKLLKLEYQKEASGRIRFLTEDEEQIMLSRLRHNTYFTEAYFITIMLDTGMRPSEIRRLRPHHLIESGWIIVEETKNGRNRRIPMTARVMKIFDSLLISDVLSVSPAHLNYSWNTIKDQMGITDPEFVPYACRHTFASRLIQRGVDLATLMTLMGHKNIQMTMRYAHLAPANLKDAINLLEGK